MTFADVQDCVETIYEEYRRLGMFYGLNPEETQMNTEDELLAEAYYALCDELGPQGELQVKIAKYLAEEARMDWDRAEQIMKDCLWEDDDILGHLHHSNANDGGDPGVFTLRHRYRRGIRSRDLYKEIMELEKRS